MFWCFTFDLRAKENCSNSPKLDFFKYSFYFLLLFIYFENKKANPFKHFKNRIRLTVVLFCIWSVPWKTLRQFSDTQIFRLCFFVGFSLILKRINKYLKFRCCQSLHKCVHFAWIFPFPGCFRFFLLLLFSIVCSAMVTVWHYYINRLS